MSGIGTTVSGLADRGGGGPPQGKLLARHRSHSQGTIQCTGRFWGIHGPHTSQVWPIIGEFPTAPPGMLGLFRGFDGLQGTWSIPYVLHKQIVSGSLTTRAIVDGAIPPLADTTKAVWDSATPLRATVRVTNADVLDRWQNWLVGGGIFLGVGAALLAALLFELLRPTREASPAVPTTTPGSAAHVPQSGSTGHKPLPTSTSTSCY